jgi:3-dehydrosphinganine reductase
MQKGFASQIALITGGSSGIGLELARQLCQQGAHVWLVGRNPERLSAAAAMLTETIQATWGDGQQRIGTSMADVSDPIQAQEVIEAVTNSIGLPDLVINSAGFAHPGYFHELDLSIFRQTMEINYFGTLYITKAIVPGMMKRGSGHIVNISSGSGILGAFGYSAYSASKFAITGFSDVLRAELKPHGIHVSVVFPSDIDTPQLAYETQFQPPELLAMAPLREVMTAETVARSTLRGIARGKYLILPGFESKLIYVLTHLLGPGVYPVMDLIQAVMWKQWVAKKKV